MSHTAEGIDEPPAGQADRHRVDREVPARQVRLDVLRERDRGLAVVGVVDLLAEGRDLDDPVPLAGADRAEPHPDEEDAVRPPPEHARGLGGSGRRREVQVPVGGASQDLVAHATADEVQLVSGGGEPLPELVRERIHLEGRLAARGLRPIGHDRSRIPPGVRRSSRSGGSAATGAAAGRV